MKTPEEIEKAAEKLWRDENERLNDVGGIPSAYNFIKAYKSGYEQCQNDNIELKEEKYVYVTYDPLYEKVICVHSEPDKYCELCEPIQKERDGAYYLEEHKHLIQTKLK